MEHHILTKNFLFYQYCVLGKSQKAIAKDVKVSSPLVGIWMKKYGIVARKAGRHKPALKDSRVGNLLVVCEQDGCDSKHPVWKCKCDCGEFCFASSNQLIKRTKTSCPKCGYKRIGVSQWTGHGEISGHFWGQIKWCAKVRNLSFDIKIEDAWELYVKQNKRCAITDVPILISKVNKNNTASLDRIDSSKEYVLGNVQWVHKRINWMKGDMPEPDFVKWCKLVVRFAKKRK